MNMDNQQALGTLELINKTSFQTRRSIAAKYSSPHIILWGCIAIAGYLLTQFYLRWVWAIWIILGFFGWLGMFLISGFQKRSSFPTRDGQYLQLWWQPIAFWTAFYVFAFVSLHMFKPPSGILLNAYIIVVVMFAYIIIGIWKKEAFIIGLGITISAAALIGVYWIPVSLYCLWMAFAMGGLMIGTGIYLQVRYR